MKDTIRTGLTVRQAAFRLGYTQKYVRDLLYEQKMPGAYKNGRVWLIPASAIESRLKNREALSNGQRRPAL